MSFYTTTKKPKRDQQQNFKIQEVSRI